MEIDAFVVFLTLRNFFKASGAYGFLGDHF